MKVRSCHLMAAMLAWLSGVPAYANIVCDLGYPTAMKYEGAGLVWVNFSNGKSWQVCDLNAAFSGVTVAQCRAITTNLTSAMVNKTVVTAEVTGSTCPNGPTPLPYPLWWAFDD